MPESQLVKYSEQKSQDHLTDKTLDSKLFLKNQQTPALLAFKRQSSIKSPCGDNNNNCNYYCYYYYYYFIIIRVV